MATTTKASSRSESKRKKGNALCVRGKRKRSLSGSVREDVVLSLCRLIVVVVVVIGMAHRCHGWSTFLWSKSRSRSRSIVGTRHVSFPFRGPFPHPHGYRHGHERCASSASNVALTSTSNSTTETQKVDDDCSSRTINSNTVVEKPKVRKARRGKDRRAEFIGMAKAVDRGQWPSVYAPGGKDGTTFVALSGLPRDSSPYNDDDDDDNVHNNHGNNELFTVLGIESSCDDTGAAVVRSDGVVLGEALVSQDDVHREWGGVVPDLARQSHVSAIDGVVALALQRAGMDSVGQVDAVGATVGPGLELCLRVGADHARQLSRQFQKPFVGVHHLEAHVLVARMCALPSFHNHNHNQNNDDDNNHNQTLSVPLSTNIQLANHPTLPFPFLTLLVSGGHCQLLRVDGIGRFRVLGGTIDDSLGEAFDKTARLLGLPGLGGGGGPALEQLALHGNATAVPLPIPMTQRHDLDLSYAGLKSSVRRHAYRLALGDDNDAQAKANQHLERKRNDQPIPEEWIAQTLTDDQKADLAASFQRVAIRHVEHRLARAMDLLSHGNDHANANDNGNGNGNDLHLKEDRRNLAVVGGVAANAFLRERLRTLCDAKGWTLHVPPPALCTDQGTMAAWAAIERLTVGSSDDPHQHDVYARYPFASTEH